jgi:hypothetical protein
MKIKFPVALIATVFATSVFADGAHDYPKSAISTRDYASAETGASPSSLNTVQAQLPMLGKTREQVQQELVEAERAGLVPFRKNDYPPSQRTINLNRARFSVVEKYWASK